MLANIGSADRITRIVVGVIALALGYYYHSYFGLLGLLPLLTGIFRWCGLYSVFGVSTCKEHTKRRTP